MRLDATVMWLHEKVMNVFAGNIQALGREGIDSRSDVGASCSGCYRRL
jgi:hypothetical protein